MVSYYILINGASWVELTEAEKSKIMANISDQLSPRLCIRKWDKDVIITLSIADEFEPKADACFKSVCKGLEYSCGPDAIIKIDKRRGESEVYDSPHFASGRN